MKTVSKQTDLLTRSSQVKQKLFRLLHQVPFLPSYGKYNLTISEQNRFIWFRVAKVGTRSIYHHLKDNQVVLDVDHASDIHYSTRQYSDYFKFAFVRNPWDRLVSCWLDKVVHNNYFDFSPGEHEAMKSFSRFVDFISNMDMENCDRHLRLQSALIDLSQIDFLGRMENFDRDLDKVLIRIGVESGNVVKRNVSKDRKPYRDYYDDTLIAMVESIYQKDIQIFGYRF